MKHVLITDHDRRIYDLVEQALNGSFTVAPLPIGHGMDTKLYERQPELILLTAMGEDSSSWGAFEDIMKIPEMNSVPVIFLVGQNDADAEIRAMNKGADDVITVPFAAEVLLHRINNCIELHSLRNDRAYVNKYLDAVSISIAELVECRDETTGGHLKNTTKYFNILLEEYYKDTKPLEDIKDLLRSAALHDIGKIGINDDILRKSSSLDNNEYEYMKTHTVLGKQAFEKIIHETGGTRWLYLAKDIAYCHHERWDGTGYPNGLKGNEIPIYARMLTVADVYDALTSRRSYKEPYSHQKAMIIILEGKGSAFDPEIVDLFIEANERFEDVLLSKS